MCDSESDTESKCPHSTKCPVDIFVSVYRVKGEDKILVEKAGLSYAQYIGFVKCYNIMNKNGKYAILAESAEKESTDS